jgi:hypothetical protein
MMRSWKLLTLLAVAALVTACGVSQPGQPSAGNAGSSPAGGGGVPSPGSSPSGESPGGSSHPGAPGGGTRPPATTSLVSGSVAAGPVTPVSRPGQSNTRPVAGARVEAMRGTDVVAVASTDHAGHYQVQLAPGSYVIAVSYPGLRPFPMTKTAVVTAGQPETLSFELDTGIR